MALDLEEQEQVDELKALWKKYGKYITRGVIAFFVLYGLYQGCTGPWFLIRYGHTRHASMWSL